MTKRLLDIVLFTALMVLLYTKALVDLDVGWDNLNYHLPFAAMRSGIFGEEFKFSGWLTGFYEGFPPLQDLISGYLWKLTGFMNAANLLTVTVFLLFVVIAHGFSGVPLIVFALAIAAIPTIHTQLVGGHVDNLSNLPFGLALVLTFMAATQERRDYALLYASAVGGLAFAANVRLQFVFLSSVVFLPISALFWSKYFRHAPRAQLVPFLVVFVLGALAIGWLPIRNLILFQNPLYPIALHVFGWQLPGNIMTDSYTDPHYLVGYPYFVKWLLSVSEYRAFDYRSALYTIAQGDVPQDAMSFRMGGYLFIYVSVSLVMFVCLAWLMPRPRAYWVLATALALTVAVANIPSSHELRFFSFWMVTLVSCVLCMLWADTASGQIRVAYAIVCVAAFWFVASGTNYFNLVPQGFNLMWVEQQVNFDEKVAPRIHPNETYCVVGFGKYVLALAPKFHPELGPYNVFIANGPQECRNFQILSPQ